MAGFRSAPDPGGGHEALAVAEEIAPRFGGTLILEVDTTSPQVAEILAERGSD
jgi:hypothetical protein